MKSFIPIISKKKGYGQFTRCSGGWPQSCGASNGGENVCVHVSSCMHAHSVVMRAEWGALCMCGMCVDVSVGPSMCVCLDVEMAYM